jgi:hypothetical protein
MWWRQLLIGVISNAALPRITPSCSSGSLAAHNTLVWSVVNLLVYTGLADSLSHSTAQLCVRTALGCSLGCAGAVPPSAAAVWLSCCETHQVSLDPGWIFLAAAACSDCHNNVLLHVKVQRRQVAAGFPNSRVPQQQGCRNIRKVGMLAVLRGGRMFVQHVCTDTCFANQSMH